jgi:hypothetical protein
LTTSRTVVSMLEKLTISMPSDQAVVQPDDVDEDKITISDITMLRDNSEFLSEPVPLYKYRVAKRPASVPVHPSVLAPSISQSSIQMSNTDQALESEIG